MTSSLCRRSEPRPRHPPLRLRTPRSSRMHRSWRSQSWMYRPRAHRTRLWPRTRTAARRLWSARTAVAPDVGQSVPAGKDVVVGNQQLCPKDDSNCLDGAPVTRTAHPARAPLGADAATPQGTARSVRRAASPQSADPDRASPRVSARQQERIHSSRHNRRAAQRNPSTVSRPSRWQDRDTNQASNWPRDRATDGDVAAARPWGPWQERQADQASSRAWDRAADENVSAARPSGRRQGRDPDQASSWRRDRYDEYPRGDDRRVVDRAAREDDRMGRARRDEGPLMAFPPVRYGW